MEAWRTFRTPSSFDNNQNAPYYVFRSRWKIEKIDSKLILGYKNTNDHHTRNTFINSFKLKLISWCKYLITKALSLTSNVNFINAPFYLQYLSSRVLGLIKKLARNDQSLNLGSTLIYLKNLCISHQFLYWIFTIKPSSTEYLQFRR